MPRRSWKPRSTGAAGATRSSDIPGRYFAWHVVPSMLPYHFRPIEYPVVIGYTTWLTAWFGRSATGFFVVTGLLGVGLALLMTVMLSPLGGHRIWRWVFGVPLALYAFHNWDLLAMVPAIAGLLAFDRGRDRASGALLALGGCTKVFPALFVPPLAFLRWRAGDRRGALNLVGAFALAAGALNAPIALLHWHAWVYPASFQGSRPPTWGSLWHWLFTSPGVSALVGAHVQAFGDALVGRGAGRRACRDLDDRGAAPARRDGHRCRSRRRVPACEQGLLAELRPLAAAVLRRVAGRASGVRCLRREPLGIFVLVFGHLHGGWSSGVVTTLLPGLVAIRALTIVAVILTALRSDANGAPWSLGLRGLGHQLGLLDRELGFVGRGPALQAPPGADLGDEERQRGCEAEHDRREHEGDPGARDDGVVDGLVQRRGVRGGQPTERSEVDAAPVDLGDRLAPHDLRE